MFNVDTDDFNVDHFIDLYTADDDSAPSRQCNAATEAWWEDTEMYSTTQTVDLWSCERYR